VVPDIESPKNGLLFVEIPPFETLADKYLGIEGRTELQNTLLENPDSGDMIQGAGGARKIRVALPGKGKSGGARVIYYYRSARNVLYFLTLYPKNKKTDVTSAEKKVLKNQIKQLNEEDYP